MKLQRLLLILFYLQGRGLVRTDDLAGLLAVSKRTVYRDIEELRAAGVAIESLPGAGGGFALEEGYGLERLLFSNSNLASTIYATKVLERFKGTIFTSQADELAARLEKLFGEPKALTPELAHRILIDPEDGVDKSDSKTKLKVCEQAVFRDMALAVEYVSPFCRRLSTCGRVDPYGIVSKAGNWFLVGFCHELQQFRVFNIAYMKQVTVGAERFSRDAAFRLEAFWDELMPR